MLRRVTAKLHGRENGLGYQTLVYGLGKGLYKGIAFVLVPFYLRYLTPCDYGILETLGVTRVLIFSVIVMGIPNTVVRFYLGTDDMGARRRIISTAFWQFVAIQVPVFLVLTRFNKPIAIALLGSDEFGLYIVILGANIFLISFRNIPLALYRAQARPLMFAAVSLIVAFTALSANIFFVAVLKKGVEGILWGNFAGGLVGLVIVLPSVFREIGFSLGLYEMSKILRFGVPLALGNIPNQAILSVDRFILGRLVSLEAVGVYALAAKLGCVVNALLVIPFQQSWEPFFFSTIKEENAAEKLNSGLVLFSFAGMLVVLIVSLYAFDVIKIIAPPVFEEAYKIVPLLCYGYLLRGFYHVLRMGILATDKTGIIFVISVIGLIVNVFLNFLLIPPLGVAGPAIALLVTYLVMTVFVAIKAHQAYRLQYDFKPVFVVIITGSVFVGISALFHFQSLHYDLVYKTGLLSAFLLITYRLGIFQVLSPRVARAR